MNTILDRLLQLPPPKSGEWLDYRPMFDRTDGSVLIAVVMDAELLWAAVDTPESWAPVHAWRALAQLGVEDAIVPLLDLMAIASDDDWIFSDVPRALAMIGPASLPHLASALLDRDMELLTRAAVAEAMVEIGTNDPVRRDVAVARIVAALEPFEENDQLLNALLIGYLVDLRAVEAAGLIEAAFASGCVDVRHNGDWENVQIELGLLSERITPPPDLGWHGLPDPFPKPRAPSFVEASPKDQRARARAKRQAAAKSRARNRRKR